jgi:hypothetical protein
MSDAKPLPPMPDRLCTDPRSPFYAREVIEQDVGIRFNDRERHDVAEYCISEGWVRVPAGKTVDRRGNPLMLKLKGKVEAFYRAAEATTSAPAGTSGPA